MSDLNTENVESQNDESVTLPEVTADPTLDTLVERVSALRAEKEQAEAANVTLTAKITEVEQALRESQYAARRASDQVESRIVDALKESVSEGDIDLDTAKVLAERLDVDPDRLVSTYEVVVTITVRVTGVKAEDEDEAGNTVTENISVDLSSYGVEFDSCDVDDVQVDEVNEED